MKYCRFQLSNRVHHGLVETTEKGDVISSLLGTPPRASDPWGSIMPDSIPPDRVPIDEAKLLAPIHPPKIICIGRNYKEHAAELGNDRLHPLPFDIRDRGALERAFARLPAELASVDLLVNNAGLARGLEPAQRAALDAQSLGASDQGSVSMGSPKGLSFAVPHFGRLGASSGLATRSARDDSAWVH